jgi:hypothetical protein
MTVARIYLNKRNISKKAIQAYEILILKISRKSILQNRINKKDNIKDLQQNN